MTLKRQTLNYLGFAGHGNLGDDAILEVYREQWPDWELWPVPVRKKDVAKSVLKGEFLPRRGAPLLLGGGTVLGRTIWRHHIARTNKLLNPRFAMLLGAGVEDPEFVGDKSYTSLEELKLWQDIVADFGNVTVRGPRSQEILASVGIPVSIVGDPALLLGEQNLDENLNESGPILVNLTHGEDQWGGTDLNWVPSVVESLRELQSQGRRIDFVSMEPEDYAWNDEAARALGGTHTHHKPSTTADLVAILREARLVIGTRLHTCVLAVAVGVPTVALEYRPKCRDFMASVRADEWCVRVDRIESPALTDLVERLLAGSAAQLTIQNQRVRELRGLLRDEMQQLTNRILSP